MLEASTSARSTGHGTPLEALLSQVALGNREAFETLYRETAARLFGICLSVAMLVIIAISERLAGRPC